MSKDEATEEAKVPPQPHFLGREKSENGKPKRVRILGKWRKPGYKPSEEEEAEFERRQEIRKATAARIDKINKGTAAKK